MFIIIDKKCSLRYPSFQVSTRKILMFIDNITNFTKENSLFGILRKPTGCSAGIAINYLLIAHARKQPISSDMCHFFH